MSFNVKKYVAAYITIALVAFGLGAWVDMPVLAQQPVCPAVVPVCGGGSGGGIAAGTTAITGGTDTRVIFNDGGVWGEDAGFTYAKVTDTATLAGAIVTGDGAVGTPAVRGSSSTSGVYWTSSGQDFNIARAGAQVMVINSQNAGFDKNVIPLSAGTKDLGAAAVEWRQVILDKTITAGGTTGARTINKNLGTVNFAAAATAITVTDSQVTTSSLIFTAIRTADATCTFVKSAVPGSGSFVITLNAGCTAETSVAFLIMN